jgi:metal-sulfur cluster biosynthetic enzyme
MSKSQRIDRTAVREQLDRVTDPELDRSIVELEYIDEIEIDGGSVAINVTLPTAWCSPAFAWMMMIDAREELSSLSEITDATVDLRDHMHAAEINEGVNEHLPFEAVFDDADGDIEAVRQELDEKARAARQYRAVSALLDGGAKPEQIVGLLREDLTMDSKERATVRLNETLSICVDSEPLERYLEKATATGVVSGSKDRLFVTPEGEAIPPSEFETVHRRGRLAATNMSGQGHVCANLADARIGSESASD